jgi:hypothetical protein
VSNIAFLSLSPLFLVYLLYIQYFYPLATNIIKEEKWANRSPCSHQTLQSPLPNTYLGILEHLLTFLTYLTILFLEGLQEQPSWPERGREDAPKMKQMRKYITNIYILK